jgi:hypothetical protein
MGDWVIWLSLTQKGTVHVFPEPMAAYRLHNTGIWIAKGKEQNLKDIIDAYTVFIREFDKKYKARLRAGAKQFYNQLLDLLSSRSSPDTIEWTKRAFLNYRDIRQFRYLLRYFRNRLFAAKAKNVMAEKQSTLLP